MPNDTKKSYKIKISADRTLGPLDWERIEALVLKGRIQGNEPTSVEPFTQWKNFSNYPELSALLLKKMELDANKDSGPAKPIPGPAGTIAPDAGTRTLMASQPTRTMIQGESTSQSPAPEVEKEESYGIPTLVNIKPPPAEENPDLERTIVNIPALRSSSDPAVQEESEGGTKILKQEHIEQALQPYVPPSMPDLPQTLDKDGFLVEEKTKKILGIKIKEKVRIDPTTGKRRFLSKNTAAILAMGLLLIAYWSSQQESEEDRKNPDNIVPKTFTFPYIEVNQPPPLGNVPDPTKSFELMEKGVAMMAGENPSDYVRAIKNFLYPAVGRNPQNVSARGLLASAYIRIAEIVPRDERLYSTLNKLLLPQPPAANMTPEYVAARAEHFLLLQRLDQAQEILDTFLRVKPTPELLYQRARVSAEKKEFDAAIGFISKAIPPEGTKANARHLLFMAKLLERKNQVEPLNVLGRRLLNEHPNYGLGILWHAEQLFKKGNYKESQRYLSTILNRPHLLDRLALADSFTLAAKVLEAQPGKLNRAIVFAEAARNYQPDRELADDLVFRLKSKLENAKTKEVYGLVNAARQKERAKEYEPAKNIYIKAIESDRSDPVPFYLLGNLYEKMGLIPEAVDRYQKSMAAEKKFIAPMLALAEIYIRRYELESARNIIKAARGLKQRKDVVEFLNGRAYQREFRKDLAEVSFDKALAMGSRYPELYIQMGDIESERNQKELAEFYYSMALRYDPLNAQAILGAALTRFYLESPSRAIGFLKDKLAAQPNSAPIMTSLAIIYLRSGDQDSGKNYLQNAIRSDSKYAYAFKLLGDLTRDEGNRQKDNYAARRHSYRYALASYEMYSKLAPNDPEGFKATADLYYDVRDLGAAAKNYYRVLELAPNYPDVRLKLSKISRNGGDTVNALKHIEEELKVNPRSDAALVEKGNIHMAKREFANATQAFTQAAKLNEKNSDALFGLGVVHHLQGNYDNALSLFDRVIKLDPLNAEVYWQMCLIYQKLGNKPKALQAANNFKGLSRDPQTIAKADQKIRELMR